MKTWDDLVGDVRRKEDERKAAAAAFLEQYGRCTFRCDLPQLRKGAYLIVSPSAKRPGEWQGTIFDELGPSSDVQRRTWDEVVERMQKDFGLDLAGARVAVRGDSVPTASIGPLPVPNSRSGRSRS